MKQKIDSAGLISCLQDTLATIENDVVLKDSTMSAINTSTVYREGFTHSKSAEQNKKECEIAIVENTSFDEAKKYTGKGRIAVLNFANPVNPGGGVENGAMAQEECLCRSSNLYPCLKSESVQENYYKYNYALKSHFYSDRLIYTKDVTVFKTDGFIPDYSTHPAPLTAVSPETMAKKDWFNVDIITCAAPYIAKRKHTNQKALKELFKRRIRNIFESALENEAEILILGAFGCGAFKNPPFLVAEAFNEVIIENSYRLYFKEIVFAVKRTDECPCPNIMAFQHTFYGLSEEMNLLRFTDGFALGQAVGQIALPSGRVLSGGADFNPYIEWKRKNKYFGKQFSILGDSLSTLDGYNPRGYSVFYQGENCEKSGVNEMKDSWWGKVIDYFDGELLVNNSWSGSRVTKLPKQNELFPSGCSDQRTGGLHINSVNPDVIIVYIGTNDWANGVTLSHIDFLGEDITPWSVSFMDSYEKMLSSIKRNYPDAEIWCCTLNTTFMSSKSSFSFPDTFGGVHIEKYNEIIRSIASKCNCGLIDLYSNKIPYDAIDGSHPTVDGMSTIATLIIRRLAEKEFGTFMDCKNDEHDFIVADEYTGGTKYVCKKCGKENHTTSLFAPVNIQPKEDDVEYISLDPDKTTILYSDTIELWVESRNEIVSIQKEQFRAGRDPKCDLNLGKENKYIARIQATFFYENQTWYLRDENSTNGTWLNDTKLQPGKKYQLCADDVINFAHSEKVTFYKAKQKQDTENNEAKAIAMLEAGISVFAKSENKDEVAFKLIVAALSDAPLYFPIEIDTAAMLGGIDPTALKPGDTLTTQSDVGMRILTISLENGTEIVPMFTSNEEVNKGQSVSTIRYYPQDYLSMLIKMNKPVIINPFSEFKFVLTQELMKDVLLPIVEEKTNSKGTQKESATVPDDLIGVVIKDKYKIIRLLGHGDAFSMVYLAQNTADGAKLTIKASDKGNRRYSEDIKSAMLQESLMLMKLNHPAIPKVVDITEDEKYVYIVRNYMEGKSLDPILKTDGAQPVHLVVSWAKQLCNVLQYLHTLTPPIIYRDMKPANVILTPDGDIKIVDFDIAIEYVAGKTSVTPIGTKGYAAPEQYVSHIPLGARTDIYGLGITLYYLLTGVDPISDAFDDRKPMRKVNSSLPKSLERIVAKCIERDPENRYQSCKELLADLDKFI